MSNREQYHIADDPTPQLIRVNAPGFTEHAIVHKDVLFVPTHRVADWRKYMAEADDSYWQDFSTWRFQADYAPFDVIERY